MLYGQLPECTETVAETVQVKKAEVKSRSLLEITFYQDGDAATSEDTIEEKVQTFHDIGITNLVNQGYVVTRMVLHKAHRQSWNYRRTSKPCLV